MNRVCTAILVADDMDTPGRDLNILQTVIVPYDLLEQPRTLTKSAELPAGQFKRYFIQVPEGAGQLNLELEVGRQEEPHALFLLWDGRRLAAMPEWVKQPSSQTSEF